MLYSVKYGSVLSLADFAGIIGRTLSIKGIEAVTRVSSEAMGLMCTVPENGGNFPR